MKAPTYYPARYAGLTILQEARKRKKDGFGYRATRKVMLWKSKTVAWNWLLLSWGIRWSDKWQVFPVWFYRNNSNIIITLGFWKAHVTLTYHR